MTYTFTSGQILTAADLNNVFAQTSTTATNASTLATGTVVETVLPYRMDQDVRSNSDVQFRNGVFTGNLTVSGTMTYVNTATLDVKDINVTIAKGAANSAAANGAGITIDGASVNFKYDDSTNMMLLDHLLSIGNSTVNAVFGYSASQLSGGQFIGNVNNYFQIIATNANTGPSSSGDYVVADDAGISSTNYVDMGINGSGWSNTLWTINGPSDSYLYASGGNLAIGTASRKATVFFANGTLATNEVMQIDAGANVNIGNVKSGATSLTVGNTTVNTVITSTAVQIGNNVSNTSGMYPASNSTGTELGSSTKRWIINANTVDAGNTTVTGFVNATVSVNSAILSVGTSFIANTTGVYHTGVVNALSYSVGSTFTANATLVNAAAINITGQVNTATLYAATSANIGTATVANATGVYTTGTVNALSITTTNTVVNTSQISIGTVNSTATGVVANTTTILIGNSSVNATVNSTTFTGTSLTANNASYLGGVAAANYVANSGDYTISGIHTHTSNIVMSGADAKIIANGGFGAVNYVLSSNGTGMYWADLTVSAVNTLAQYTFTNNHTFGNTTQQANVIMANGYILANTINATSITTTSVTINTTAVAVGSNVYMTTATHFAGNSTVNAYMNATTMFVASNSTMNTVITANQITLNGSNVVTTATALKVYDAAGTQVFP